jgi:predicted nucleotidyltransferase
VRDILKELAPKYGFFRAYIFGYIVKQERFRRNSDVDIAVFDLKDEDFFRLMAEISRKLERNVKICQMETIDEWLRRDIEAKGVLWKRR